MSDDRKPTTTDRWGWMLELALLLGLPTLCGYAGVQLTGTGSGGLLLGFVGILIAGAAITGWHSLEPPARHPDDPYDARKPFDK